jgi:hypothetical protein
VGEADSARILPLEEALARLPTTPVAVDRAEAR